MFGGALIDGLQLAREGRRVEGDVPLADLPRLADELLDHLGSVLYVLTGFVDERGRPGMAVETRARVALVCQRCLGRLDLELSRSTRFMLVGRAEDLPELSMEETEVETVEAEAVANVVDLVEQEVLLGLPISPVHAQCSSPAAPRPAGRESPFAVLDRLKDTAPGD